MLEELLSRINKEYTLTPIDSSEFDGIKVAHMRFKIKGYTAEGLGSVSTMTAKGFFGLLKMDTLIVIPREIDLPLFSYDRIHAAGNDTILLEFYDTLLAPCDLSQLDRIKNEYSSYETYEIEKSWLDDITLPQTLSLKGKRIDAMQFNNLAEKYLSSYLETQSIAVTDIDAKMKKSSEYREGLLENGGTSTNIFIKKIGRDRTEKLYREILFRS